MKKKRGKKKIGPPRLSKRAIDPLEELKGKWFRPEAVQLLRLEDNLDEEIGFKVDSMPSWGDAHLRRLFEEFTDGHSYLDTLRLEFLSSENFGELLGVKSLIAQCTIDWMRIYDGLDDASKAKFVKAFGGPEAIVEMRKSLADARKIMAVEHRAFLRVRKQTAIEKGHFFKGYGRGLLLLERMQNWIKKEGKNGHKKAYVHSYIFLNWQEIDAAKKRGGWPEILKDFRESLPDDTEIHDETFAKALTRAGFRGVGKVGRPKKLGQKSLPVS